MNFEESFNLIDAVIFAQTGKHLCDLQTAIFRGAWEGEKYKAIAEAAYCTEGHIKDVAADFWKQLSEGLGERIGKKNFKTILEQRVCQGTAFPRLATGQDQGIPTNPRHDWGEAPDVSVFFGRTAELTTLKQWIVQDKCRLVVLLGMAGIGKTALAAKLAHQLRDEFEFVIWRSLRNAPPVEETLAELIQFLSEQQETALPAHLDGRISQLFKSLRACRCLLVLDNAESILQSGDRTGRYREGYQGYGQLLKGVGETQHKSCLVLTSREKPQGLAPLEGETLPIRCQQLKGLSSVAGREIWQTQGSFTGSPVQWQVLIERYAGNPLALKIVASAVRDFFESNLSDFLEFLKQDSFIFDDLRHLLIQQFQRLSHLEQEIMYWLAINREPVSFQELQGDFLCKVSPSECLQSLAALQHRSLIEKTSACFTQQPVVMEYMTNEFIEEICEEIASGKINRFSSHALVKAQTKDYVRETQVRLILEPVIDRAIAKLGSSENLENSLAQLLERLRGKPTRETGYAGGNILNLLRQLQVDLNSYDFSQLTVWQANLEGINLHNVNFADSDLAKSVFSETLGSVLSVALSPDGKLLATGDVDSYIRLWQVATGQQLLTFRGHSNWVRSVAFSPDGQTLASGSSDHTVRLWEMSTGNCIRICRGHRLGVSSVSFSPDGQTLASGSYDHTVKFWQVSTGSCLGTCSGHRDWVNSVAFSPDSQILVSGSSDHTVRLWQISTGRCFRTYSGHCHGVSSVAFSPDGQTLASGSADCTVKFWQLSSGQCLKTCTGHKDWVNSVAFSSQGQTLVSGSSDHTVKLWQVSSGHCLRTFTGHRNGVWSVACVPRAGLAKGDESSTLASGSFDHTVRLWDVHTGQSRKTFTGDTNWVRSVVFSNNCQTLVSGHTDHQVRIWDDLSGKCCQTLSGHTAQVCAVALSADGNILASGSYDETIRLWDSYTGKSLNTLIGHSGLVCSVAFSSDGKTLASGGFDHTVKLWDVSSGDCLRTFKQHKNVVWSVAFSPDGHTLASASADHTVKLWDISSGNCLRTYTGHDHVVWSVAFSPDGHILASASADHTVKLWDVSSGNCLKTYTGHQNWVFSVAFSPDSQTLVSGSYDYTVKLWDISRGNCLKTYTGHTKEVYSVAFSRDGKTLASGSQDGTIKLWNVKTGQCLTTLRSARLYEGMNITGAKGLTSDQRATLKALGARENACVEPGNCII